MAEEISAKNNQTDRIKNGKTLGLPSPYPPR